MSRMPKVRHAIASGIMHVAVRLMKWSIGDGSVTVVFTDGAGSNAVVYGRGNPRMIYCHVRKLEAIAGVLTKRVSDDIETREDEIFRRMNERSYYDMGDLLDFEAVCRKEALSGKDPNECMPMLRDRVKFLTENSEWREFYDKRKAAAKGKSEA